MVGRMLKPRPASVEPLGRRSAGDGRSGDTMRALERDRLMAAVVGASPYGVTVADALTAGFPLVHVNPAAERLTGYRADELLGRGLAELRAPDADPAAVRQLLAALRDGGETTVLLRGLRRAGTGWWDELTLTPVTDQSGRVAHVVGHHRDVTDRVEAERRAAHLATHDPATGLPGRARLLDAAALELAQAERAGAAVAVLVIEVGGLRQVDAEHGYTLGDLLLASLALRLRAVVRADDLLGRLSDTEFVAVLPGVAPGDRAGVTLRVAEAVRATFDEPLHVPGLRLRLDVAVGSASSLDCGFQIETLLTAARSDVPTDRLAAAGL